MTKVSQSIMKALEKLTKNKICGKKFEAMYLKNKSMPPTPPMQLGNWFEYTATGQLPRDGNIPLPKTLKSGKLGVDYVRMESQVENYKNMIKENGFEVVNTGYAFHKNKLATGISDVMARKDGRLCIIDIKTSGLLDDRWNEMGWELESLEGKHNLMVQAVHYKTLAEEEFGEEVDFYFAVFSSKNEYDCLLIKVNIDEASMQQHYVGILKSHKYLGKMEKIGFSPSKKYRECVKCFLSNECEFAQKTPEITNIYY